MIWIDRRGSGAHLVTMRVGYGKDARWVPSYLPTLLRIGADTGRRLASILALRGSDWRPELGTHGQIRWRAAADKSQKDWFAPVTLRYGRSSKPSAYPKARGCSSLPRTIRTSRSMNSGRSTGFARRKGWLTSRLSRAVASTA